MRARSSSMIKFIVLFHLLLDLKRVFWSDESLIKAFVTVNLIA